jgi:hypothetical protein
MTLALRYGLQDLPAIAHHRNRGSQEVLALQRVYVIGT